MIKAMCFKATYDGGKLWEPGESRIFPNKEEMHPCFKFVSELKDEKGPVKAMEEMTKTELLKVAKEMGLEIPSDYNTKEKVLNFIQAAQAENTGKAPAKPKNKAAAKTKAAPAEEVQGQDKDPQGTLM